MRKILSTFLVLLSITILTGCDQTPTNKDGLSKTDNKKITVTCYDGLVLAKYTGSKYANGVFYKLDKYGNPIPCKGPFEEKK